MINYVVGSQFTFDYYSGPITYQIVEIDKSKLVLEVIDSPGRSHFNGMRVHSNKKTLDRYSKSYLRVDIFEIET